jgi:hypothetical protein
MLSDQGRQDLSALVSALEGIELQLGSHPSLSDGLDKEVMRLRGLAEESIETLSSIRQEISALERDSEEARAVAYGMDQIERFLGRLEQALTIYDKADDNAELRAEIADLSKRIEDQRKLISEQEIRRKIENARKTIETHASNIVPNLDAEWPSAPIELVVEELTIKVIQGTRDDFLWEIGSGANWLAYHLAVTLALQRFFLSLPHHPVPGLLIYDQPSQVYFPRRLARDDAPADMTWRDEDVLAVRKVFDVLASEVKRAEGRLQIIVLDHAASEVWGGIGGVELTEEWRGTKLVPDSWL